MKLKILGVASLAGLLLIAGAAPALAAAPQGWSSPNDVSVSGQDSSTPQITAAPDNTLTAIWHRFNGSNKVVQASTSTDHGITWTPPVNLSLAGRDAGFAQLTAASDNTLTAIWQRDNGSSYIIQTSTSTNHGATWTAPVDLSAVGQDASGAQITVAPDNTLTAVWRRFNGSNNIIQTSTSTNHGATWTAPVDLSAVGRDAVLAQITAAPDNTLTAVWQRSDGSNFIIQTSTSTNHGATWTAPVNLSTAGQPAVLSQITAAPDNTLTAIWQRSVGSGYIIQTSTSTDHGATWTTPVSLSTAGQSAEWPQITATSDNALIGIWRRFDGSKNIIQTSTSTDHGTTWTTPVDLSAVGQNAELPQVTAAPDNTLTAVWQRLDGSKTIVQTSTSTDHGTTWTTPVDLSAVGQNASVPQITATPDNTFTAVWVRYDGSKFIIQSAFGMTAPHITSATPLTPKVGVVYSFQVTATGFPAPTFAATGSLPTGLTLSSTGLLSGTPAAAGTFTFTITASNGALPDATATYSISIVALAETGATTTPLIPWAIFALLLGAMLTIASRSRLITKQRL